MLDAYTIVVNDDTPINIASGTVGSYYAPGAASRHRRPSSGSFSFIPVMPFDIDEVYFDTAIEVSRNAGEDWLRSKLSRDGQ